MIVIGERTMAEQPITDDLPLLLNVLPPHLRGPLEQHELIDSLLEVILDLGREPEARFPGTYATISATAVTEEDIEYVVSRVGDFGDDNRAGIPRTLHRISALRNRQRRRSSGSPVASGVRCWAPSTSFATSSIPANRCSSSGVRVSARPRNCAKWRACWRTIEKARHRGRYLQRDRRRRRYPPSRHRARAAHAGAARGAAARRDDRSGGKPHAGSGGHRRDRQRGGGAGGAHHRGARRAAHRHRARQYPG